MATQLATQENQQGHPLVQLRAQIESRASEFKMALPAHITPEKFQRTILTAAQTNPTLLTCDRRSFINACMKAATDGLLPDGREAALVPFKTRVKSGNGWSDSWQVQYMPMVYGLRKKILQSGEVRDIFAQVVYRQEWEDGTFYYEEGTDRQLRHKPNLGLMDISDDDVIAAYSVATFADGTMSFEVMRRVEINKVRATSQTGAEGKTTRQGEKITPKGPWVDWFGEMAKKTVMRRHSKTLPMSGDIIDVEGNEIDAAASGAALLASVEEHGPTPSIPSRDDGPAQLEHSQEVDQQLDREAFRQFDGQPEHDDDGVVIDREPVQQQKPQAAKRKPAPEPEPETGRADSDHGEEHRNPDTGREIDPPAGLAEAKRDIDDQGTNVPNINSRVSDWRKKLSDDDANALVTYAMEKIAEIKGGGQ